MSCRAAAEKLQRAASAAAASASSSSAGDADAAASDDDDDTSAAAASASAAESDGEFQGVTILEALSATGLRAVRYAKELDGVRQIVANDCSPAAVAAIARNVEFNGLGAQQTDSSTTPAPLVRAHHADAIDLMMASRRGRDQFDVVDLDPYGTAAIFLDAATQAVAEGGLLCVTCTDMAVLCGSGAEAGYAKYGAYSLRAPFCHEQALRIVLGCMQTHAARHKRFIVPLLRCARWSGDWSRTMAPTVGPIISSLVTDIRDHQAISLYHIAQKYVEK